MSNETKQAEILSKLKFTQEGLLVMKNFISELRANISELEKYKTACESINKDNPMVVCEHIETLVDYVNLCLKSPHLHEIDKMLGRELLNKIQSK